MAVNKDHVKKALIAIGAVVGLILVGFGAVIVFLYQKRPRLLVGILITLGCLFLFEASCPHANKAVQETSVTFVVSWMQRYGEFLAGPLGGPSILVGIVVFFLVVWWLTGVWARSGKRD